MGWLSSRACTALLVSVLAFGFSGADVRGAQKSDLSEFHRFASDQLVNQYPTTPMYRGWRLTHSGWGGVDARVLAGVLSETAEVLMEHVANETLRELDVAVFSWSLLPPNPSYGGRSYTSGEVFNVFLKPYGNDWRRYVSVYAHELCHVLDANSRTPARYRWFEETLCQVASLYTLRELADRWAISEDETRRAYAPKLREYHEFLIRRPDTELPKGLSLASWYHSHTDGLSNSWEDYSKNDVIARRLFPYFQAYEGPWETLTWLKKVGDAPSLGRYLERWHLAVPDKHRRFVSLVAEEFGYRVGQAATLSSLTGQ